MTLIELASLVRGKKWSELTAPQRTAARAVLMPDRGFRPNQRQWMDRWWLTVMQADIEAINATLPAHTRVAATEIDGALYIGVDLLTDAQAGETYFAARTILARLVIAEKVYTPPVVRP